MKIDPEKIDPDRILHIINLADQRVILSRDAQHRLNELIAQRTQHNSRIGTLQAASDRAAFGNPFTEKVPSGEIRLRAKSEIEKLQPIIARLDAAIEIAVKTNSAAQAAFQDAGRLRDRVLALAAENKIALPAETFGGSATFDRGDLDHNKQRMTYS